MFPATFDRIIMENGAPSMRIKQGDFWYEMPGYKNNSSGMYQIGTTKGGVIYHKNFVPEYEYLHKSYPKIRK